MNLLPWREIQFWQRSQKTLIGSLLALVLLIVCWFQINEVNKHQYQRVIELRHQLKQQQSDVSSVLSQMGKWRQEMTPQTKMSAVPTEQAFIAMEILTALPLEQGELQEFHFDANEISFKGAVQNQGEFEQLHQYLETHFAQLNLVEFHPQTNGALHFQFQALTPQP